MSIIFIFFILVVLLSSILTITFIIKSKKKTILELFVLFVSVITALFLTYLLIVNIFSFIESEKVRQKFDKDNYSLEQQRIQSKFPAEPFITPSK